MKLSTDSSSAVLPVLVLHVTHAPSASLSRLLQLTALSCDPRAHVLILLSPGRSTRTLIALQGDWRCPPGRVLEALAQMFCAAAPRPSDA